MTDTDTYCPRCSLIEEYGCSCTSQEMAGFYANKCVDQSKTIKALLGALGDIWDGEPEWPNDNKLELKWCRNRAKQAHLAAIAAAT